MTITNNVAISNIFKVAHKITDNLPAVLLDNDVPDPFDPANISGLRSRLLDANTFTSPISGKYYIKDSSTVNTHLPRQGRCWLFDGINDIAVFGDSTAPSTANIIACAFVKLTADTTGSIVGKSINSDWSLSIESGQFKLKQGLVGNNLCTSPLTYSSANGWIHVVSCYDSATATAKLFINGLLVSTVTSFAPIVNTGARIAVGAARQANGSDAYQLNANLRDVRIYTVTKSDAEILSIYNQSITGVGELDSAGLWAAYPCNEESGTVGYDISGNGNHLTLTNITQATFHAADTGVTANPNNAEGYRLSGSVYIPKRLTDSLAADGNALTATGRAAYHGCADTPCVTGNGSSVNINVGSAVIPATSDFSISFMVLRSSTTLGQTYLSQVLAPNVLHLYGNSGDLLLYLFDGTTVDTRNISVPVGVWCLCTLSRVGNLWTISSTNLSSGATSSNSITRSFSVGQSNSFLLGRQDGSSSALASMSQLVCTTGGVSTYFPLQDGPGSSNTNRDIAWVKSDGTGGVISNAIVNGTVSTIWGNQVPGNVEDWCIKYGGRIAANGAFIAGMLTGNNAADGSAKTLTAGKFGNPFSRLNLNPATAAELNGRSVPTSATVSTNINTTITPSNSAFERTKTDGDDRILIYDSALTGSDLTNVQEYIA